MANPNLIGTTTIYGNTSILEIHNNEPYAVYPLDKMILTSSISYNILSYSYTFIY